MAEQTEAAALSGEQSHDGLRLYVGRQNGGSWAWLRAAAARNCAGKDGWEVVEMMPVSEASREVHGARADRHWDRADATKAAAELEAELASERERRGGLKDVIDALLDGIDLATTRLLPGSAEGRYLRELVDQANRARRPFVASLDAGESEPAIDKPIDTDACDVQITPNPSKGLEFGGLTRPMLAALRMCAEGEVTALDEAAESDREVRDGDYRRDLGAALDVLEQTDVAADTEDANAEEVQVDDDRPERVGYVALVPESMGTEGGPRVAKVGCYVGDKHVVFEPNAVRVDERDGPGRCGVEIPEGTRREVVRLWDVSGPCGDRMEAPLPAGLPRRVFVCELRAGHAGDHECGDTSWNDGLASPSGVPDGGDEGRWWDRDEQVEVIVQVLHERLGDLLGAMSVLAVSAKRRLDWVNGAADEIGTRLSSGGRDREALIRLVDEEVGDWTATHSLDLGLTPEHGRDLAAAIVDALVGTGVPDGQTENIDQSSDWWKSLSTDDKLARMSQARDSAWNRAQEMGRRVGELEAAIDAALKTTWQPDEEGGWGTDEDTLHPDRLKALAALQPFWQEWGDQAWSIAGRAQAKLDELKPGQPLPPEPSEEAVMGSAIALASERVSNPMTCAIETTPQDRELAQNILAAAYRVDASSTSEGSGEYGPIAARRADIAGRIRRRADAIEVDTDKGRFGPNELREYADLIASPPSDAGLLAVLREAGEIASKWGDRNEDARVCAARISEAVELLEDRHA